MGGAIAENARSRQLPNVATVPYKATISSLRKGAARDMQLPDPLPDKACGACTACCVYLAIDDPALKKPADVPCIHMVAGRGCAIHPHHPRTCQTWQCGWRFLRLGAEMRPDRSHVLLVPAIEPGPGLPKGGLKIVLTQEGPAGLINGELLNLLAKSVLGGVPIYLTYGTKNAREALVNEVIEAAVVARDKQELVKALFGLFNDLAAAVARDRDDAKT